MKYIILISFFAFNLLIINAFIIPYHNKVYKSPSLSSASFLSMSLRTDLRKLKNEVMQRVVSQIEDDGYNKSHKLKGIRRVISDLSNRYIQKVPGHLILIRHGESEWNDKKLFTGWVDVDLNERGRREIEHAGRLLLERGLKIDVTYTSRLKRAIRSTWIILRELNQIFRPVFKSYRLNERMYGDLEGKSKPGLALELGKEIVQEWRSGFSIRPPPMSLDHKHWHGNERKYSDLSNDEIPVTESLEDTMERTLPLLQSKILPNLKQGKNVMIVAHGNSLRGIVKHIDGLTIEEIQKVGIPNGIPLLFKFDENMKPIRQSGAEGRLSGEFLEKKGLLRAALEKEEEFAKNVPGYELYNKSSLNLLFDSNSPFNESPTINPVLRGLQKLDQEKKLLDFALNNTTPDTAPILKLFTTESKDLMSDVLREGPILCIIRHGKTEHNKLGLFTGWEDATLAPEGRVEAREAGKLLKMHGIEFDVVYTSWLSRAIETAWLILNELDSLWLPIIKSWRLNERMYGKLTNMSKKMIGSTYGEEQLKKWRRSYETRPPKISSFSAEYPGNDERYVKYVNDIRFSVFESLIRSISHRKIELHRKFPKAESLKDCMDRTIPFFRDEIWKNSVMNNKNVLVASSENAIRGILMNLCDIPPERINEIEIPNGLPLIYSQKSKCIKLLDDGIGNHFERYNFGKGKELLFKPCDSEKNGDACFVSEDGTSFACDPIIRLQTSKN